MPTRQHNNWENTFSSPVGRSMVVAMPVTFSSKPKSGRYTSIAVATEATREQFFIDLILSLVWFAFENPWHGLPALMNPTWAYVLLERDCNVFNLDGSYRRSNFLAILS